MADVATPSAVTMSTIDAGADSPQPTESRGSTKPERPDEAAFREAESKMKTAFENAQKKTKDLDAKFNAAKPNNKDSPNGQRQAQLKAELGEIRSSQSANKASRGGVQDRITTLDTKLKAQIQEQKNARAKLPYRNEEELDAEIKKLEKEVDSGKMRIVDEKKNLDAISQLRAKRKQFGGADHIQKSIDALKQQISETKKELGNPEIKALSAEYDTKQAELNALRAEQDSDFKNRDIHRDAWRAAKDNQSRLFGELKAFRDTYFGNKRAYDNWDREARKQQFQRREAERKGRDLEYKKRKYDEELAEAGEPAFLDEISACDALLRLLDPDYVPETKGPLLSSKFGATAQRVVDEAPMKGTKLMSKKDEDEENYFVGSGGKKGKKGKRAPAAKAADMGIFYSPGVTELFQKVQVNQPSSADGTSETKAKVQEKKRYYQDNQESQRQKNIDAVKARYSGLEETVAPKTNGVASTNGASTAEASIAATDGTTASDNGDSKADGVSAMAGDLEKTSISIEAPGAANGDAPKQD